MIEKTCYTTSEVAEILGVHADTVREWIREGRLEAFRPSGKKKGRYRIHKLDIPTFARKEK